MRIRTALLALVSVLAFGMAGTHEAQAASVSFDFSGACESGTGPPLPTGLPVGGCNAFGLDEGDLVSGSLTLDMDVVAGDTTINVFDDPTAAFEFTFGNQTFDLGDYNDVGAFTVSFSSDATQLSCISGIGACPSATGDFAAFDNDWSALSILVDRVTISQNPTDTDEAQQAAVPAPFAGANAAGQWTRRLANPIPEPSAALMFGVGALVVRAGRRRVA